MRLLQIIKELSVLIFKTKPWDKERFATKSNAILIRKVLERLGSVFIKFGQMLALRPDFISPVFCDELYSLLDNVPPFDSTLATTILKKELGNNYSKILEFESIPVASASFAQVHKAKLKNGDILAVKIQRPDVYSLVQKDLAIMRFLAKSFDVLFQPTNLLARIVDEFESWTQDELDYAIEAKNIEKFNTVAALVGDGIRGPKVYTELSTSKILTMEYMEGYGLAQIIGFVRQKNTKKLKEIGFNGKQIINKLIRNILETSHVHGFFHADPHPANIIFTPNGELVFIDFGIVGSLSKKERVLVLRYFRELLSGKADQSLDSLLTLCGQPVLVNIEEIRNKYRVLIDKFMDTIEAKTYLEQQIKSGPILAETLNLLQKNGVKMPVGIVRYFKSFETVEGLIFALYPELQIKDMVKEFRRVSIVNIVDALPTSLGEKNINNIVLGVIDSLEKNLVLNDK
ncbi:MAG: ABC-1 domain-containing protein [Candidatus Roizmanbacteria bacterium GW2011_GWA2_37_7]|uniref:ABC-1 domain-containing protein n=1 Tax=Candidatus Roizmanbacteria bacterium GW2011_GWA2_37_7 TaxID=1618481 RepID=A0A0G0H2V8_9BACT|nr:MAG: ABC-1 domain-containing protein [Candidatus Roizmanbacteria bacterium GW2011_GWA2_37_7]